MWWRFEIICFWEFWLWWSSYVGYLQSDLRSAVMDIWTMWMLFTLSETPAFEIFVTCAVRGWRQHATGSMDTCACTRYSCTNPNMTSFFFHDPKNIEHFTWFRWTLLPRCCGCDMCANYTTWNDVAVQLYIGYPCTCITIGAVTIKRSRRLLFVSETLQHSVSWQLQAHHQQ